jgi:hypothetical protein
MLCRSVNGAVAAWPEAVREPRASHAGAPPSRNCHPVPLQ